MNTESAASGPHSFYEAVGGEEFFDRLVHRFYQLVAEDPELRAVYPAQDLTPAEDHLRLFLIQYWGGPQTYNELRERVVSAIDLALLDLQMDPQPGRTAAQLAAVGEETRRPKSPRTTTRSRTGHAGGDDPISDEIEPKSQDS